MKIRRPNAAEALAVTALVVAMSGSAVAASRYVITSSSQIKPSAIREITHAAQGETAEPSSAWAFSKPGDPGDFAVAKCPSGFEAVSGGYSADLPAGWQVVTQQRFQGGYRVAARSTNVQPAEQAKLKATVFCRSRA